MKKITILLLLLSITSPALAVVSTRVCLSDGNTPFGGGDIMVGTKLTIIVSSDAGGYWPGDLAIVGTNRDYGFLLGGNALEAAGTEPFIYSWEDDDWQAVSFETDIDAVPGDWFIIDYIATDVGDCNVGFYEWFSMYPIYEIPFSHVRTRDFNEDTKVDFFDYAMLASHWLETDCGSKDDCQGTDLDTDGDVDFDDLMKFCEYWLEKTE